MLYNLLYATCCLKLIHGQLQATYCLKDTLSFICHTKPHYTYAVI